MKDNIIARIKVKSASKTKTYKASLKRWLSKPITFESIDGVEFSDQMVLATVEFDKDHCIYVLLPEEVFEMGTPDYYVKTLKEKNEKR
jgi:hypothetical protein